MELTSKTEIAPSHTNKRRLQQKVEFVLFSFGFYNVELGNNCFTGVVLDCIHESSTRTPWVCAQESHQHPVLLDTKPIQMTAAILNLYGSFLSSGTQ